MFGKKTSVTLGPFGTLDVPEERPFTLDLHAGATKTRQAIPLPGELPRPARRPAPVSVTGEPWCTPRVQGVAESLNALLAEIADLDEAKRIRHQAAATAQANLDTLRAEARGGLVTVDALDATAAALRAEQSAMADLEDLERRAADRVAAARAVFERERTTAQAAWLAAMREAHTPCLQRLRALFIEVSPLLHQLSTDAALIAGTLNAQPYSALIGALTTQRLDRVFNALDELLPASESTRPPSRKTARVSASASAPPQPTAFRPRPYNLAETATWPPRATSPDPFCGAFTGG